MSGNYLSYPLLSQLDPLRSESPDIMEMFPLVLADFPETPNPILNFYNPIFNLFSTEPSLDLDLETKESEEPEEFTASVIDGHTLRLTRQNSPTIAPDAPLLSLPAIQPKTTHKRSHPGSPSPLTSLRQPEEIPSSTSAKPKNSSKKRRKPVRLTLGKSSKTKNPSLSLALKSEEAPAVSISKLMESTGFKERGEYILKVLKPRSIPLFISIQKEAQKHVLSLPLLEQKPYIFQAISTQNIPIIKPFIPQISALLEISTSDQKNEINGKILTSQCTDIIKNFKDTITESIHNLFTKCWPKFDLTPDFIKLKDFFSRLLGSQYVAFIETFSPEIQVFLPFLEPKEKAQFLCKIANSRAISLVESLEETYRSQAVYLKNSDPNGFKKFQEKILTALANRERKCRERFTEIFKEIRENTAPSSRRESSLPTTGLVFAPRATSSRLAVTSKSELDTMATTFE